MTTPEKPPKDDKKEEKKDDKAAHGHEKKMTFSERLVDIVVKVILVVIFLYFMGGLVGMTFDGLNSLVATATSGMRQLGQRLLDFSQSVTSVTFGGISSGLRIGIAVIGLAGTIFIVRKVLKTLNEP